MPVVEQTSPRDGDQKRSAFRIDSVASMLGGRASLLPVDHMLCLQKKENANDALTVLHKRDVMAHF